MGVSLWSCFIAEEKELRFPIILHYGRNYQIVLKNHDLNLSCKLANKKFLYYLLTSFSHFQSEEEKRSLNFCTDLWDFGHSGICTSKPRLRKLIIFTFDTRLWFMRRWKTQPKGINYRRNGIFWDLFYGSLISQEKVELINKPANLKVCLKGKTS